MQTVETYILIDAPNIINEISKSYTIMAERPRNGVQCFFDTFDWRLYNKGLTLLQKTTEYRLYHWRQDREVATSPVASTLQPKFWWDFPDSPLKEALKPCLGVRALLLLASMKSQAQTLRVLNDDEKSVLLVHVEDILPAGDGSPPQAPSTLRLQQVRGYDQEFNEFRVFLYKLGLKPQKADVLTLLLEAHGKQPGDYSSKVNISLRPDWPGRVAAREIFMKLLNVMQQNEAGLKADIDTEFLHDFRVAIRRTRSALTQLKGVFPHEVTERYKRDFAELGKLTSRLRDLDVYLLKEDEYRSMLPADLASHLEPMFDTMRRERKREHQKLVRALSAGAYKRTMEAWDDFLNHPDAAKNSSKPVSELARKFIWKKYNQVMTLGQAIADDSPDPELHNLRIDCKKLRYLLEFFATLFPEKEMASIIRQVKKLQDNLGEFNDLYVQQQHLKEFLNSDSKTEKHHSAVAAIGGLTAVLFQRQQGVRQAFAQTFDRFSDSGNAALFIKLFG